MCREFHWTYDDLRSLPAEVYDVLVQMLNEEYEAREQREAEREP